MIIGKDSLFKLKSGLGCNIKILLGIYKEFSPLEGIWNNLLYWCDLTWKILCKESKVITTTSFSKIMKQKVDSINRKPAWIDVSINDLECYINIDKIIYSLKNYIERVAKEYN